MEAHKKLFRILSIIFFGIAAIASVADVMRSNDWTPFVSGVSATVSMIIVIYDAIKIELEREIK